MNEPNKQLVMPGVPEAPASMVATIERLALDPNLPIERLERLLDMQERMMAKQAETDFNQALSAAQAATGRIKANAKNKQTNSVYANYAALDKVLRPIYVEHGFALSFDTWDAPHPEYVRVLCHLSHRGGHTRIYRIDMPADGKGAKGGDVMTKTHAAGSAASYGMRYLLKMMFNVAIGEDDNDGNGPPKVETINEDQAANIEALITEVGADRDKFLAWCQVENMEDVPTKYYKACVRELEKKRAQK